MNLRPAGFIGIVCLAILSGAGRAEVVGLKIESRNVLPGNFGSAGQFEVIRGWYSGELDPSKSENAIITDIAHTSKNKHNKVEYRATFALTVPIDGAKASGILFYDVPNRGRVRYKNGGDEDGHFHLSSGWQGDLAEDPAFQFAVVPKAQHITGPVFVRIVDRPATASVLLKGGQEAGTPLSPPISLNTARARLVRKAGDLEAGRVVQPADFAFADCSNKPFPGVPDPAHLCLKGGFDPAFQYELTYQSENPPVLGVGFAAVRDLISFLRYSKGTAAAPNPLADKVHTTIVAGYSQSGNFIRSFIRLGFNQGENGRVVFDGAHSIIAPRQLAMNLRFATPGGGAEFGEPGSDGVVWWGRYANPHNTKSRISLLDRCSLTHTCPKLFEAFGSAEFWALRMSPDLVGFDAKSDIPLPPNVRRYYFPGTRHGGGVGGFALKGPPVPGCTLWPNPNPSFDTLRALTKALVAWVRDGKEPPASRYPTIAAGDLVAPTAAAMGFPNVPGAPRPDGKINPLYIYDFGSRYKPNDASGIIDTVPPRVVGIAPSLVPRVNADGNEIAGIASVQMKVPLGTYLGWNELADGHYRQVVCNVQGGFIPFAKTRAERMAKGDPRLSIEERYHTHQGFVDMVEAAANEMVSEGFLMKDDAQRIINEARESDVLVAK